MLTMEKCVVALFVDRTKQQWIVRDPEGNFWSVPSAADAWDRRERFDPKDDTDLEPIPGHYKYLLQLPF